VEFRVKCGITPLHSYREDFVSQLWGNTCAHLPPQQDVALFDIPTLIFNHTGYSSSHLTPMGPNESVPLLPIWRKNTIPCNYEYHRIFRRNRAPDSHPPSWYECSESAAPTSKLFYIARLTLTGQACKIIHGSGDPAPHTKFKLWVVPRMRQSSRKDFTAKQYYDDSNTLLQDM